MLAVIAGSLLFISRATEYFENTMFWIKMALIVIAGINMVIFEFITVRGVKEWNLDPTPPPRRGSPEGSRSPVGSWSWYAAV